MCNINQLLSRFSTISILGVAGIITAIIFFKELVLLLVTFAILATVLVMVFEVYGNWCKKNNVKNMWDE